MKFSNEITRSFFSRMLREAGGNFTLVDDALNLARSNQQGKPVSEALVVKEIRNLKKNLTKDNKRRA